MTFARSVIPFTRANRKSLTPVVASTSSARSIKKASNSTVCDCVTGLGFKLINPDLVDYQKRYLLTDTFFIACNFIVCNKVVIIFLCASVLFPSPVWSDNCSLSTSQREKSLQVKVEKVIDGDTLRLSSGKLVRLIGINTPEIDHKLGNSQTFAEDARDYLRSVVRNSRNELLLLPGIEKEDRHSRLLAHIFSPKGKNIQAEMLHNGLGVWIVVPPNLAYHVADPSLQIGRPE